MDDRELEADAIVLLRPALRSALGGGGGSGLVGGGGSGLVGGSGQVGDSPLQPGHSPCSTEEHEISLSNLEPGPDTRIWLQDQPDGNCAQSEGGGPKTTKRTKSIQRVIRDTAHSHTSGPTFGGGGFGGATPLLGSLLPGPLSGAPLPSLLGGTTMHTRRRALQVLTIENGSVEKENLAASQLLQIVRNSTPGHERGQSGGLKLRDIRQISNTAIGSQRSAIEPRRGCVVINMPSAVKALILADKVILIAPDGIGYDLPQASFVRREASSHVLDRLTKIARPLVGSAVDSVIPHPNSSLAEPLLEDGGGGTLRLRHHQHLNNPSALPKLPTLGLPSISVSRGATTGGGLGKGHAEIKTFTEGKTQHEPGKSNPEIEPGGSGGFNVDDEFDEEAQSSDDSLNCGALVRKLVRLSAMEDAGPFEFLALECILFEVIRKLTDVTYPACEIATHTKTAALSSICTTGKLHQIRELKKMLQDGAAKAEGISQSLTEVLGSEEDIRRLELSRFRDHPGEWDEPSASHGAEDVEILLESYQQDIQGLIQRIEDADETLDLTIQMMQLQLATTRTVLLKIEIALQVVGVVVGFVSAVAGLFGMNLSNGFENRRDIFWSLSAGMFSLILFSIVSTGWIAGNLNL